MANVIKLRKGLDINLKGAAAQELVSVKEPGFYSLVPDDYTGITPKVVVKEQEYVMAGGPLFIDKNHPELKFVSPVSGVVTSVERGARRKVLNIVVEAAAEQDYEEFGKMDPSKMSAQEVKEALLQAGMFAFIRQRPYDVIADPTVTPKAIFISAFDSNPLAPDFDFVLKGNEADLQAGVDVLRKLTGGNVYMGVRAGSAVNVKGAHTVVFEGPHPAGNVGIQIHHIAPLSKGETVWTLNAFDLLVIGRFFGRGKLDFTRLVALTGSEVKSPHYVRTILGAEIDSIVADNLIPATYHRRYISGNVLTGTRLGEADYLRAPHCQITVIPEGDDCHELLGWAMPGFGKYSVSHLSLIHI